MKYYIILLFLFFSACITWANDRVVYVMDKGWRTVCYPEGCADSVVVEDAALPHNWNDYYDWLPGSQGLHGEAVYQLKFLTPDAVLIDNRVSLDMSYELCLEGAGTAVTIVLNNDTLCKRRPIGFVSATFDVTSHLEPAKPNDLKIVCHHPSTMGNGPFGLFRRVSLIETDPIHVLPDGVHAWTNAAQDTLFVETEIRNDNEARFRDLKLSTTLHFSSSELSIPHAQSVSKFKLSGKKTIVLRQAFPLKSLPQWSPSHPIICLLRSEIKIFTGNTGDGYSAIDAVETQIGFRKGEWTQDIRAVREGERRFGQSYAFDSREINSRIAAIQRLGYNALQEASAPHSIHYGLTCARRGMYYVPLFFSSSFVDTPQFRQNFKSLLRQWVRTHRNNPALVAWALQDEHRLPEDFVAECCDIIRQMDPLCDSARDGGRRQIVTLSDQSWVADTVPFECRHLSIDGRTLGDSFSDTTLLHRTQSRDSLAHHLLSPIPGMTYLYRYNCGGDSLIDSNGNLWMGDDTRFSHSWSERPAFASQQKSPVAASYGQTDGDVWLVSMQDTIRLEEADARILSSYRWGRHDLSFSFPADSNQNYCVELFFVEPFASRVGQRDFDVEINGQLCLSDLDLFRVVKGPNRLFKISVPVNTASRDVLQVSFPRVSVGQAVISAISISRLEEHDNGISERETMSGPSGYPYSAGKTWKELNAEACPESF